MSTTLPDPKTAPEEHQVPLSELRDPVNTLSDLIAQHGGLAPHDPLEILISLLADRLSTLIGMGLVIMGQGTFIVFILWMSALQQVGHTISKSQWLVITSIVLSLSLISLIGFVVNWAKNERRLGPIRK